MDFVIYIYRIYIYIVYIIYIYIYTHSLIQVPGGVQVSGIAFPGTLCIRDVFCDALEDQWDTGIPLNGMSTSLTM